MGRFGHGHGAMALPAPRAQPEIAAPRPWLSHPGRASSLPSPSEKKTRWSVNSHGKWTIFGFLGPDLTWWWINMMIFNMMDLTCFFLKFDHVTMDQHDDLAWGNGLILGKWCPGVWAMPFGAQSWPLEPKSCGAVRKWGGCPPKKS